MGGARRSARRRARRHRAPRTGRQPAVERPILLVSGKDDHGLVAQEVVEILDRPAGRAVGNVPDGTLVYVVGEDREWLEVETLEGRRVVGWINDFYLRGQVHLVGDPPACPVPLRGEPDGAPFAELAASQQVVLVDHHGDWVGVQPVGDDRLGVVPRGFVSELPGPPAEPGVPCQARRGRPGGATSSPLR